MKIKSLTIKNFKGFASTIEINFGGKNLVIFGENGTGKTSTLEALKLIFNSAVNEIEIDTYKNIFTLEDVNIKIKTIDNNSRCNEITLKTKKIEEKDEIEGKYEITITDSSSYSSEEREYLESLSRSTAILSYRELMKIYSLKTNEDFYDLLVRNIMAHSLIPPMNEKTLIEELNELEKLKKEYNKDRRKKRLLKKIIEKENLIKNGINNIFSELREQWNNYIKKLTDEDIEVNCFVEELGKLKFEVKWNGKDVKNILTHLNEGKLNAIALGLFLAYFKKFNSSPYKMLLLDDVVIGLDMNLRIPILDILKEDFEDEYQIILTTFDENWFNLMKEYLDGNKWQFLKLVAKKTDNDKLPFIIGVESADYLNKAKNHLRNGDIPAAALYIRLEFERIVKKYAKKKNLEVKYNSSKIEDIWIAVKRNLTNSKTIIKKVEVYRSILLNPSVHYDSKPKYQKEVSYAINVVEKLKNKINKELNTRRM